MFVARAAGGALVLSGMVKNASNQSLSSTATNVQITGWVNRSGQTANIVSDKLVISGSGTCTINGATNWSGQQSNPKFDLMMTRAGVDSVLSTQTGTAFQTTMTFTLSSQSLLNGDALWFRCTVTGGFSCTISAGTGNAIYLS